MKAWRCSCGKGVFYGSDYPKPCQGCSDCHSKYGSNEPSEPHQWTTETTTRDGEVVSSRTYCKTCYKDKRLVNENTIT